MRQTKSLPPTSVYPNTAGFCKLLRVPAGRWPFPTLSLRVFLQMPGPLPRRIPMVHLPVSSHRNIGLPPVRKRPASHNLPHSDFSTGLYFGAAVIPLCSSRWICLPPRSLLPLRLIVRRAAVTFTSEHHMVCYLPMRRIY